MKTFEELEASYEKLKLDLQPIKDELEIVSYEFKAKMKVLEKSFFDELDVFLDEKLIDKNGIPVKVGNQITNGKNAYIVGNRGVQFVFGLIFNNPKVIVKKIPVATNARLKELVASDLIEFEVINNLNK